MALFKTFMAETGRYVGCTILMIICYLLGNVLVSFVWGMGFAYDTWRGVMTAAAQTAAGVFIYGAATTAFSSLQARHVAVPVLIAVIFGVAMAVLSYVVTGSVADAASGGYWLFIAGVIALVGWGGFAFYRLSAGD